MDKHTPRYKAQPAEQDLPKQEGPPQLKVCKIESDKLVIPPDVRSLFLSCPVFGPEWRELLASFDKQWSAALQEPRPSPVKRDPTSSENPNGVKVETKEEDETFDWSKVFCDEPSTYEDVKKKHGADQLTELPGHVGGLLLVVAPGPALYVVGKDAVNLEISQPLISHGPVTWLLGDKATKFLTNSPGKGFLCQWQSDEVLVCIEDSMFQKHVCYPCRFLVETCLFFHIPINVCIYNTIPDTF
jgi:hypothetical protein